LGGFDGFERYLYYESGSATVDTYGTHSISSWPKESSNYPYVNVPTTASAAETWYSNSLALAEQYDRDNVHQLQYTLPDHVLYDEYNDEYVTFTNMVGQYFDVH